MKHDAHILGSDNIGPHPYTDVRFLHSDVRALESNVSAGQVAQLVEQWTENPCVAGSIPALPIAPLGVLVAVHFSRSLS